MLVLTRRDGESLVLTLPDGRTITMTILKPKKGGVARIGIEAPDDVRIDREEVYERRRADHA